jgi:glycosyltransferase involved in cell wall biosynthesis
MKMATVIIPAHNEAAVIAQCLDSIVGQDFVESIIVACNACADNTADIVKNYEKVRCLEIVKASKTNAINEAEKYITSYPVFYIDADTYLEPGAIQDIIRVMAKNSLLLAAPTPIVNISSSSWLVRGFYRVWLNLPYIKEGVVATCSYVITREGRERFSCFPEVISDDGFVRGHFEVFEMANISSSYIHINAPKDICSLIKIKTRARLGNIQLLSLGISPVSHAGKYKAVPFHKWLTFSPIDLLFYILIQFIIRFRAARQFKHVDKYKWESDNSTRE